MLTAELTYTIATYGAIIGLAISIVLIIFKLHPVYSLIIGALVGSIVGLIGQQGATFAHIMECTLDAMTVKGVAKMLPTILRILTSGVLAGALIKTGSAEKIATTITDKLGDKLSLVAIALSTMIICAVGVFIDIAVITVAPIAITIAKKNKIQKSAILIAMIGGGKAGNIISPNPNATATATAFKIDLTTLMVRNIGSAILALGITILIAFILKKKCKDFIEEIKEDTKKAVTDNKNLPNFWLALLGPIVVIILLALSSFLKLNIDPLIALPIGGVVTILVTGHAKDIIKITGYGLSKVVGIVIVLIGTGALAGVISSSGLKSDITNMLKAMNMPMFLLAPFAGFFFAAATASTTSGATIASETFASTLISNGVSAAGGASMVHASATILDSLPHGSFFHATGGSVEMDFKSRLKLIPFEALIGLTATIGSVITYLIFK